MAGKKIPINLALVEQLSSNGATFEQIALSLGISVDTLARRRKDSADVAEAIKKGKAKGSIFVMSKLMELISEKNLGAIIFYLKTQCDWKETNVNEVTGKNGGPVEIKDNKDLSGEELKKELEKRGLPTDIFEE